MPKFPKMNSEWYEKFYEAIKNPYFWVLAFIIGYFGNWLGSKDIKFVNLVIVSSSIIFLALCTNLSYLLKKYSKELNSSVSALSVLKEILKCKELERETKGGQWLIHNEKVKENELSEAVHENWTLTSNFHYEINDFKEVFIKNMLVNLENTNTNDHKTKYKYIYPGDKLGLLGLAVFREMIIKEIGIKLPKQTREEKLLSLNKYVEIFQITENIIPLNEGIHNPTSHDHKGLLMTPDEDFPYYMVLDPIQTTKLCVKFQHLMDMSHKNTDNKEKLFLTEEIIEKHLP